MSYKPTAYWPTADTLQDLGFYEGYGELWLYDGTDGYAAIIDFDEYGTSGYIQKEDGGEITFTLDVESLEDLQTLIDAVNAPF